MRHIVFKSLFVALLPFFFAQCASSQKWLEKLNKGLDKTNEVLNSLSGSTEQQPAQPTDTAGAFLAPAVLGENSISVKFL